MRFASQEQLPRRICLVGVLALLATSFALAEPSARSETRIVYESDFESAVGDAWSNAQIVTLAGNSGHVLAPQNAKENLVLHLKGLPEHEFLLISFRLVLFGDKATPGRDQPATFAVLLDGDSRRPLYRTTLSAQEAGQTFPDEFPGPKHDPAVTSVRFIQKFGTLECKDRLCLISRHAGSAAEFAFQIDTPGFYGIDDVRVEAVEKPEALSRTQIDELWDQLDDSDPYRANEAIPTLVLAGDDVVGYLIEQFRNPRLEEDRFEQLLEDLGTPDWQVRRDATDTFIAAGYVYADRLASARSRVLSTESQRRIDLILRRIREFDGPPRLHRALRVLRLLGSRRALEAMNILADICYSEPFVETIHGETYFLARRLVAGDLQNVGTIADVKKSIQEFEEVCEDVAGLLPHEPTRRRLLQEIRGAWIEMRLSLGVRWKTIIDLQGEEFARQVNELWRPGGNTRLWSVEEKTLVLRNPNPRVNRICPMQILVDPKVTRFCRVKITARFVDTSEEARKRGHELSVAIGARNMSAWRGTFFKARSDGGSEISFAGEDSKLYLARNKAVGFGDGDVVLEVMRIASMASFSVNGKLVGKGVGVDLTPSEGYRLLLVYGWGGYDRLLISRIEVQTPEEVSGLLELLPDESER